MRMDGQADMTKLTVTFSNFENASKKHVMGLKYKNTGCFSKIVIFFCFKMKLSLS